MLETHYREKSEFSRDTDWDEALKYFGGQSKQDPAFLISPGSRIEARKESFQELLKKLLLFRNIL